MTDENEVTRTTAIQGNVKTLYKKAVTGDRFRISGLELEEPQAHPLGIMGYINTETGIQVYINDVFHHEAQSVNIFPFHEDVLERVGNNLILVTNRNGKIKRKSVYKCNGLRLRITPHSNGGIIIENNDPSTQTLTLLTKPGLGLKWTFTPVSTHILHVGKWNWYYSHGNSLMFNADKQFFKDGKPWFDFENWKGYRWWPFENSVVALIGTDLVEYSTQSIIWKNIAGPEHVNVCNGNRIVIEKDNICAYFSYDKNGNRHRHEVALCATEGMIASHHGMIFREPGLYQKPSYKLLVIK